MANHSAAKKHARQTAKRNEQNRYYGKTTRNAIRDLLDLEDHKKASEELPKTISMVDKLKKRGIIHKNKAAHLKSRLSQHVNQLATAK